MHLGTDTGDVEQDEVWKASDSPHIVSGHRQRNGTLTIEPCSYVRMVGTGTIDVMRTGTIDASGTADSPIVFESNDSALGFEGISQFFEAKNGEPEDKTGGLVKLSYVTFNGGGESTNSFTTGVLHGRGSDTSASGFPLEPHWDVHHVAINGSASFGAAFETGSAFTAASEDLTIKDAADGPLLIGWRSAGTVPTGNYSANPKKEIILEYDITSLDKDVTIRDRGVPYHMGVYGDSQDMRVGPLAGTATATLTIEAGVQLTFGTRTIVTVTENGLLQVNGTAAKPVIFTSESASPAPGDWGGIRFDAPVRAGSRIDHAEVRYAGQKDSSTGFVCEVGTSNTVGGFGAIGFAGEPPSAFVTNTTIRDSASHGIVRGWDTGGLTDLEPTNTFSGIAECKQSYPRRAVPCPDPVPCDPAL